MFPGRWWGLGGDDLEVIYTTLPYFVNSFVKNINFLISSFRIGLLAAFSIYEFLCTRNCGGTAIVHWQRLVGGRSSARWRGHSRVHTAAASADDDAAPVKSSTNIKIPRARYAASLADFPEALGSVLPEVVSPHKVDFASPFKGGVDSGS